MTRDHAAIHGDDAAHEHAREVGGDIRRGLDGAVVDREDVGDRIDQQARRALADLRDDDDVARRGLGAGQAEPDAEIDDRQHDAAQVDDAADVGRARAGWRWPASSRGSRAPT